MAAALIARSASEYCASLALYRASKTAASYSSSITIFWFV